MASKFLKRREFFFLVSIYVLSLALRLIPKLYLDSHLPAFQGDVWYRITMAQYIFDNWSLPEPDIRYRPYGYVPMWYPPLSVFFLALLSKLTSLDIPTVVTRILPFFEGFSPLSIYFLARYLYNEKVAIYSVIILSATPSFVYWTGIGDPQSMVLFLIPIYILYFLKYSKREYQNKSLILMGIFLGIVFLFHLSYFVLILSLLMVSISLFLKRVSRKRIIFGFAFLVFLSQLVALWWWYPRNLYWWWIHALTSSSQYYTPLRHFFEFGMVPAILGFLGLSYLGVSKNKNFPLIFFWTLPLLIETQNETILNAVGRIDLSWETLAKPLEGFRFYPFLSQPFSLAAGVFLYRLGKKFLLILSILILLLTANLWHYNIDISLTNAGMLKREYDAAVWYRENSDENSLIVADYYRSQMIAGVCGGKALIGGLFPLRNVEYPYIKAPPQVQNDIYTLYVTEDLEKAMMIVERYKITHIFYSSNLEATGYFGTSLQKGFGLPVYRDKFFTKSFIIVYQDEDILIFKVFMIRLNDI